MQFQNFYHKDQHPTVKKGRRPRTTDDPEGGPEGPTFPEDHRMRRAAPAAPAFPGQPSRHLFLPGRPYYDET